MFFEVTTLILNYIFLSAIINTDTRKTMKNAISTGVKISSQPISLLITFFRKSIKLNNIPNEITAFLKPV